MNNKQTLKQVKQLIGNNRVDKALELLFGAFHNSEYNNEIILHTNNFNDYKKKERLGVISLSDANTFKNQIVDSLLRLIDDIDKGKKSNSKESEVEKPAQQVINIINSKNVNTGNINTDGGDFKIGDNCRQKANQIKPYIEVDLILLLSSSTKKDFCRISNEEHKKEGEYFFQPEEKPIFNWELRWEYSLELINNSSQLAINIKIEETGQTKFSTLTLPPTINNIPPYGKMVLTAEYSEMVKGKSTEVDELLKHKTPKRLNDFELTILFCDEDRKEYNTIIKIENGRFIKNK